MLNSKLEEAIKEVFRLSEIKGGAQAVYEKDGEQFPVRVQLIWIVEILQNYLAGVTVVGVKTEHMNRSPAGYTGLLLVPPIRKPLDRDFGGRNLKPVDMEWPNSIITAFESVNIASYERSERLLGSSNYKYNMHLYTSMSVTHINFDGYPVHENQWVVLESIAETVSLLGEVMGDPEILEFLDECDNMDV